MRLFLINKKSDLLGKLDEGDVCERTSALCTNKYSTAVSKYMLYLTSSGL